MKAHRHIMLLLLVSGYCTNLLLAQTIEEQMAKSHPNCQTMLMNAMDILPRLYREKSFDSLQKAVEIWERSCADMPEIKITRILLDIEEETFILPVDDNGAIINLLNNYATSFPSPSKMQNFNSYSDSKSSFYRFSSVWAKLLLENKKLDKNEKFICKVLKGEIKNPEKEIQQNVEMYPEFAVLADKNFRAKRKEARFNLAVSTGVWLPTGNLTTIGVHPSFGLHAGIRSMRHEVDFTMQIRYLHSANPYAVKIEGQMDSTDYYFGGYIGIDYTYFLVSKKRYEIGLIAGMGWDGFDFAPQPYDYDYYYPYYTSHVTIGTFNINAGLRFNYYFTHSFYVGLLGRYNGIDYSTHGGTDLTGNAFSIDLIFGIN